MATRRHVRYEEYAAHGPAADDAEGSSAPFPLARKAASGSAGGTRSSAPPMHSAAASHRQNDAYMEAFDAAYEDLVQKHGGLSVSDAKTTHSKRLQEAVPARLSKKHSATREEETVAVSRGGELSGAWLAGPASPEGTVHNVSAQPIMCMSLSLDEKEIAVGSSDHAAYTIPVSRAKGSKSVFSGARPRTLFTKKFGHTEWVTCSTYLQNNRLVTGGMDSKICLWDASGVKCEDLVGHAGSITLVRTLGDGLVLSASYDKTVRVWNVSSKGVGGRDVANIKVGSAPILDASVLVSTGDATPGVVTGDRDGCVHLLDLDAGKVTRKIAGAHKGHTTSVLASRFDEGTLCFSGGQDGTVRVWDLRQSSSSPAHALELHVDRKSGKAGAVGFLQEPADDGNVLITGGADGTIKVLDKRKAFKTLFNFTEHMDFIYSMHVRGQLCFSGAGNGMLHVHDWKQGKLLYGLGANKAAVRAIETTSTQLIAAGDDGSVIMYDMV